MQRLILAPLVLCSFLACSIEAAEMQLRLADGRAVRGQISDRTDADFVWISQRTGSTVLLRAISYPQISHVTHDGRSMAREELKASIRQIARTDAELVKATRVSAQDAAMKVLGFASVAEFVNGLLGF